MLNEIIEENFQNTGNMNPARIHEGQRTTKKFDKKRSSPRHAVLMFRSNEYKERIMKKVQRKDKITFRGKPVTINAGFSEETLRARREWSKIIQILKKTAKQE